MSSKVLCNFYANLLSNILLVEYFVVILSNISATILSNNMLTSVFLSDIFQSSSNTPLTSFSLLFCHDSVYKHCILMSCSFMSPSCPKFILLSNILQSSFLQCPIFCTPVKKSLPTISQLPYLWPLFSCPHL
jgi:hypothetical protein